MVCDHIKALDLAREGNWDLVSIFLVKAFFVVD